MHPYRPTVMLGALLGVLALFLPFVSLPVVGVVDGIAAEAWPALVVVAPVALMAAFGDWAAGNSPLRGISATILGCGATVLAATKLADAIGAVKDLETASLGAGAPLLVGSMALVTAGAALSLRR